MPPKYNLEMALKGIVNCTDVLLEVLSFGDSIPTIGKLILLSHEIHDQLHGDKLLWFALTAMYSCPICVEEARGVQFAYTESAAEYWKKAARMVVASRRLRQQWGVIFTSRIFVDINSSIRQEDLCVGQAVIVNTIHSDDAPGLHEERSKWSLATRVRECLHHIYSWCRTPRFFTKSEGSTEEGKSTNPVSQSLKEVATIEMKDILTRFLGLQSGILLDSGLTHIHLHERHQALSSTKWAKVSQSAVGVRKSSASIQISTFIEATVTPEANPRQLPVLTPFSGRLTGKKTELRTLAQLMYAAVGGGCGNNSPVRWFVASVRHLSSRGGVPIGSREVLLAVCFNHPKIKNHRGGYISPHPNAVKVVAITKRNKSIGWLSNAE